MPRKTQVDNFSTFFAFLSQKFSISYPLKISDDFIFSLDRKNRKSSVFLPEMPFLIILISQ